MNHVYRKCRRLVPQVKRHSLILVQCCQHSNKIEQTILADADIEKQKELFRLYNKGSHDFEHLFDIRKSQLVYKVIQMQRQIDSYENTFGINNTEGNSKIRIKPPDIEDLINFKAYNSRRIAFKVVYLGWDYMGYAWSENSNKLIKGNTNVVERVFLEALLRKQLIQDIHHTNLDRCGRTDKGVSGLAQVISVNVRSNLDGAYGLWRSKRKRTSNMNRAKPDGINEGLSNPTINLAPGNATDQDSGLKLNEGSAKIEEWRSMTYQIDH
uniref:uncharacterized protein LOC120330850 n=1 Tax=Styela clava TaxID=7725 RepID=UPI001939AEA2|nr:uncharacterized protein LOC120330850 [Styela clava]